MELTPTQRAIWEQVRDWLAKEQVASPDHVERMTSWCQKLGRSENVDMDVLICGALVHDVGVLIDRKRHYTSGREKAKDMLISGGQEQEKIEPALHVMETHSRYGGPDPETLEAKIGQDADALEYIGAIGILRAVIRGLNDGSFDGNVSKFPDYLRTLLSKVDESFHTHQAEEYGKSRIAFMQRFLEQLERELNFEV